MLDALGALQIGLELERMRRSVKPEIVRYEPLGQQLMTPGSPCGWASSALRTDQVSP